jgi:hypothetical protein
MFLTGKMIPWQHRAASVTSGTPGGALPLRKQLNGRFLMYIGLGGLLILILILWLLGVI